MTSRFALAVFAVLALPGVAPAQTQSPAAPPAAAVQPPPASGRMRPFLDPLGRLWEVPGRDGLDVWFAATDSNGDGQIDRAEITRAASGWFTRLDLNGDGVIDPDEETAYEQDRSGNRGAGGTVADAPVADRPLAASSGRGRGRHGRDGDDPDIIGARTGALMDVSNPVVSADINLDRGVSRAEAITAATRRLALLDGDGDGMLSRAEAIARREAQADYRRTRVHQQNTPPIEQRGGGNE